jgi:hypothetical protein
MNGESPILHPQVDALARAQANHAISQSLGGRMFPLLFP